MVQPPNLVPLIALLHDIGKVCRYYDEIWDKLPKVRCKHDYAGYKLLTELGYPDKLTKIVQHFHDPSGIPHELRHIKGYFKLVKKADVLDAGFRGRQEFRERREERGRKESVNIKGWKPRRTCSLHGGDPLEILKRGLKDGETDLERCTAVIKEVCTLLTSDPRAPDISLYVHTIMTAAIAVCLERGAEPTFVILEADPERRATFATLEKVEYLSGLQLNSYLGLMAVTAKTLSNLNLLPFLHIISITPLHLILLIPQNALSILMNHIKALASDIGIPVKVRAVSAEALARGEESKWLSFTAKPVKARLGVFKERVKCEYCDEMVEEHELYETKWGLLCPTCFLISNAYYLLERRSTPFSVIKGMEGVIHYKRLGLSVVFTDQEDALLKGLLNPQTSEEVVSKNLIPFDIKLGRFEKEKKFWLQLDFKNILNESLRASTGRMQRLSTATVLMPIIADEMVSDFLDKPSWLKLDPTSAILQVSDKVEAFNIAYSMMMHGETGLTSTIIERGRPGITFRRLIREARSVEPGEEPHISLIDEGRRISRSDIRELKRFLEIASKKGINRRKLLKIMPRMINYASKMEFCKSKLDKALVKSEVLCKLTLEEEGIAPLLPFMPSSQYDRNLKIDLSLLLDDWWEKLPRIISTSEALYHYNILNVID